MAEIEIVQRGARGPSGLRLGTEATLAGHTGRHYLERLQRDVVGVLHDRERIEDCADGMYRIAKRMVDSGIHRIEESGARLMAVYLKLCVELAKLSPENAQPATQINVQANTYGTLEPARQAELDRLRSIVRVTPSNDTGDSNEPRKAKGKAKGARRARRSSTRSDKIRVAAPKVNPR